MPSRELGRVDSLLTTVAVGYRNAAYVADRILPVVGVRERSGKYPIFGREAFRTTVDTVTPDSELAELRFEYELGDYHAEGHGHKVFVPFASDFTRAPFEERRDAVDLASDVLLLNREQAVTAAVTDAAQVPNDDTPTAKWDEPDTDVVSYVESRKQAVAARIGRQPNKLVLGPDVFAALLQNEGLLGRIQYSQRGVLSEELLAALLGLDEVVVANAVVDGANEGQAFSGEYLWPAKTALLLYNAPNVGTLKTPSFGKLLYWTGAPGATTGIQVRTWDDPGRGSHGGEWVAGVHYYEALVTQADAAERLVGVLG